ncbi:hypothetical protein RR48_06459 [Papilio machaon]|uniref:C2H2-type domain-containing protein n=1 Tax=Papilio machaon TaxID=76193 RepID=A0A194RQC1_PAPMA|nr:hypothetical protein RR48_06459 [Papilio machaon]
MLRSDSQEVKNRYTRQTKTMSSLSASGVFSSCVDYFCLVCESRLRDGADAAAHVAMPVHTKNFLTTEYFLVLKTMSALSASGVFSSCVDYFCLVCESRLRDGADATAHVAKPVHTKNFLTTEYFGNQQECVRKIKKWYLCELCNVLLPTAARVRLHVAEARHAEHRAARVVQRREYFGNQQECVRKIKKWYLCELCNVLLPTAARVRLHVAEARHAEHRAARVVQRRADRILAFASVQLKDSAWNGILDDTCAICNTEFDDEHIHRNETSHILKLIQSKIEYDENQNLYRRVDDNTFHCITCNKLVAFNSMDVHFNDDEHKNLYQCFCEENKFNSDESKVEIEAENVESHIERSENIENVEKNELINDKEHSEKDKNDIQQINTKKITEIFDTVKIDEDENSKINLENDDILSSIENFNRNNISINVELKTATCKKCEKDLDFQMKSIKDHILEHEMNNEIEDFETTKVKSDTELTEEMPNGKTSPAATVKNEQEFKKVRGKKIKEHKSNFEAKQFANENDMTYLDSEDKVYCIKCKVNIPTSLKCLQEHVAGSAHLKAINKQHLEVVLYKNDNESNEEHTNKIAAEDFVQNKLFIDGISKCVVINDTICISVLSSELMLEENNKLKCLICEQKLFMHDFESHIKQYHHNKKSSKCFVLELSSEFIREIKPQCFHCGYCNNLHSPWSAMLKHIQSADHRESRSSAHIRLQRLMPEIIQHRRQHQLNRMMAAFGFMFGANRRRYYDSDSD